MSDAHDSIIHSALKAELNAVELTVTPAMVAERVARTQSQLGVWRVATAGFIALASVVAALGILGIAVSLRDRAPLGTAPVAVEPLIIRSNAPLAQDICIVARRDADGLLTAWWYNPGDSGCRTTNSSLVEAVSALDPALSGRSQLYIIEFSVGLIPDGTRPVRAILEFPPGGDPLLTASDRSLGVTRLSRIEVLSPAGPETPAP